MSFPFFDFGSAPPYQQLFDYAGRTDQQPVYIGWATPGVQTSAAKWKIRQFTYNADGGIASILWANGDIGFTQIWDNRSNMVLIVYK